MEKAVFNGMMAVIMRENSLKDKSMGKQNGLNLETTPHPILTKEAINLTKKMVSEPLNGSLGTLIREISKEICERATGKWLGMRAQFTLEIGTRISKMAMASSYSRMAPAKRASLKIMSW